MFMVKSLVLSDKIYNGFIKRNKDDISVRYLKYLNEMTQSFSNTKIKIKKLRQFDNRFEILISGPEEIFIFNMLKKKVGTIIDFDEIEIGKVYKGVMGDVGKVGFGIFVDCGILNPKVDVLLNLYDLRTQLCKARPMSITEVINAYDFIDQFPVFVKVTSINKEKKQIQGKLDQQTLGLYEKLIDENLEAVFMSGDTKGQLKKAIVKSGHSRDVVSIDRYGFLENIVILQENTTAPGIIAEIGKYLKNCNLSAIRPKRIKMLFL
ncbi:MAG: DUF2110 family protein [Candidatus Lokiarchaeota archaeon]|nr:DUF2110 family protein [Candidatus Lokiarchaeota archaeon]